MATTAQKTWANFLAKNNRGSITNTKAKPVDSFNMNRQPGKPGQDPKAQEKGGGVLAQKFIMRADKAVANEAPVDVGDSKQFRNRVSKLGKQGLQSGISPEMQQYEQGLQTALGRRFDLLRQRAEQGAGQREQQAREALQRSAAARGRLGSGALQKQAMLQERELAGMRGQDIADVESQREVAAAQLGQQGAERRFQAEQALQGRLFQAGQSQVEREYAQRQFDQQMGFRDKAFSEDRRQFNEQMLMEMEKFGFDKYISEFNKNMAKRAQKGGGDDIATKAWKGSFGKVGL